MSSTFFAGIVGRRFLAANLASLAVAAAWTAVVAPAPAAATGASPTPARANALLDPAWDDGRAEVARYDAVRPVYGKPRSYELVQVLVKEPFDPVRRVKPDAPREGTIEAFKLVRVDDLSPEGREYRHRQTLTVRVARQDPRRLLLAALGTQDWCGVTYARLEPRASGLLRHVHSYFDGEGDREDEVPGPVLLEDQLPATLRGLPLEPGWSEDVRLLPSVFSNEQPLTAPVATRIAVEGDETLSTPAGSFPCARVRAARADAAWLTLWVARTGTRPVVRLESSAGRRAVLRSAERAAYWHDRG